MAEIELYDDSPAVFTYEDAGEDADALREADTFIAGVLGGAWYAIAGKVKEMHDRLAKHGRGGMFGRWAATHNWSRDTTARRLRRYDFVLNHPEAKQQLLSLPTGVIDVAARPSTPPEVVDEIVAGKVKTVKQAKAMRGDATPAADALDDSTIYSLLRKAEHEEAKRHATAAPVIPPEQVAEMQKVLGDMLTPGLIHNMMEMYKDPMGTARNAAKTAPKDMDKPEAVQWLWGFVLLHVKMFYHLAAELKCIEEQFRRADALEKIATYEREKCGITPETREALFEYFEAGDFDEIALMEA